MCCKKVVKKEKMKKLPDCRHRHSLDCYYPLIGSSILCENLLEEGRCPLKKEIENKEAEK